MVKAAPRVVLGRVVKAAPRVVMTASMGVSKLLPDLQVVVAPWPLVADGNGMRLDPSRTEP